MQHAEVGACYQGTAVQAHTADGFGCPNRVTGEELVVFGRTQETDYTQFHHQVVDKFLRLGFGNHTVFQVAFDINIQERRHTAEGHRCAVLRFNGGKVGKVSPLDGFLCIFCRAGNVVAVRSRHFFHLTQGFVLFVDFFTTADHFFQVHTVFQIGLQ